MEPKKTSFKPIVHTYTRNPVVKKKVTPGVANSHPPTATKRIVYPSYVRNLVYDFDDVYYISLERRPDRREAFLKRIDSMSWPFKEPKWFKAIDANDVPAPATWKELKPAYAASLSHLAVCKKALDENKTFLILEDDVIFVDNFATKVKEFLANVPANWDCLMIGGCHCEKYLPKIAPNVSRCTWTVCLHCYVVRGDMLKQFVSMNPPTSPTDQMLASLMKRYKVYSPEPLLAGQSTDFSDIERGMRNESFTGFNRNVKGITARGSNAPHQ